MKYDVLFFCKNKKIVFFMFFSLIIFFYGLESVGIAEPKYIFLIDPEFKDMRDKMTEVYMAYPINKKYKFLDVYSFLQEKSDIIAQQIYYDKGLKRIIISFAYEQKIQGKHVKTTICLAMDPVKPAKSMENIVRHSMILGVFEVDDESFDLKDNELKQYLVDLLSD